jgi:CYTH domain-containing protein
MTTNGIEIERKFLARLDDIPPDAETRALAQGYLHPGGAAAPRVTVERVPPCLRLAFSDGTAEMVALGPDQAARLIDGAAGPSAAAAELAASVYVVRVRIPTPGTPELTVKRDASGVAAPGAAVRRPEENAPLAPDQAVRLFSRATSTITKVRVAAGGWEVDTFDGALHGLVIAEAELSADESPLPPAFAGLVIGPEVTHDPRFLNAVLATMPPDAQRRVAASAHAMWPARSTARR